jgi:NADH-quinone oxidoreductase subunit L
MWMPAWIDSLRIRLYVLFMHRLYVDQAYERLGRTVTHAVRRLDKRAEGRLS